MAYLLIDKDMRFHELKTTKIWSRIYQGCYDDALELAQHNPEGITYVLNCTPDPIHFPEATGIKTRHICINDGYEIPAGPFWSAMRSISEALLNSGKVLVNCHAGISRSTSMIAGWMSMCGFGSVDECIDFIKQLRPIVQPHPDVLKSVKEHLKEWPYNDPRYQR